MTSRAKLEIAFDRTYNDSGCFMHTKISTVVTEPDILRKALVVQRAYTNPEAFVRMAADQDELTTFPELPTLVNRFKSATYFSKSPAIGDLITIIAPFPSVWEYLHDYLVGKTYTVTEVNGDNVVIDSATPNEPFPDYARDVHFYVMRSDGVTPVIDPLEYAIDGEADRDYVDPPVAPFLYLANEHYDLVSENVDEALNFLTARQAEAQGLVNKLNQDSYWVGTSEELYE